MTAYCLLPALGTAPGGSQPRAHPRALCLTVQAMPLGEVAHHCYHVALGIDLRLRNSSALAVWASQGINNIGPLHPAGSPQLLSGLRMHGTSLKSLSPLAVAAF
eukprot:gnl/TRDRNA2_/TRDRNA2_157283_c1_seq1.p1 gnl/TRDRNA2_/TRDRNA2_157283_c1~~gnl/TRDRNA2_/TRDRNA2_157283_c1_seq1.p1  ORF type:complete len:104 (-),score=1.85 gnl/TRDRNA2_/TRDRNA2_157283_c1_seq1:4-315(-)